MNSFDKQDLENLKARVDLRRLVADLGLRLKKHRTRYDQYFSPFRNDGKNASFIVYFARFKDYGGSRVHGDHIDLIQGVLNCTKREAIDYLANYAGNVPLADVTAQPVSQSAHSEPPDTIWQNTALTALERCERNLWSDTTLARRARAYLNKRGLSDATIRSFRLGLSIDWFHTGWKDADGESAKVHPGIVIPIFYNGALWALRVRQLHKPLSDKYLNVRGSKLTGALFAGDAIRPDEPLLMVEGEFDAMLAGFVLPSLPIITPGPVSNTPQRRQLEHIRQASVVYILMDNDEPGQGAAATLAATIGDKAVILPPLPAGKDVTEYVCEHGGDLAAWFAGMQQTQATPFPAGVPDCVRSVLMNRAYFPDSAALGLELVNEGIKAGYIKADGFTAADYVSYVSGFDVAERTARKILSLFVEIGFLQLLYREKDSVHNLQKPPGGRPTAIYTLTDPARWSRLLMDWIAPRLYEQAHTDKTLAQPTAAMMRDSGVSVDANAAASEFNAALKTGYALQGNDQVRASKKARRELIRITEDLKDPHSTPLPPDWPRDNARAYRRAFTHAVAGGGQRTRRDLCRLLGVSNTALSSVLKDAGIEQIDMFEKSPVTVPPQQLERELSRIGRYELDSPGVPCALVATLPNGNVMNRDVYRDSTGAIDDEARRFYADVKARGATVEAKFRVASAQKIVRETPPETPAPVVLEQEQPPQESKPRLEKIDMGEPAPAPRQRHYGPTYDPAWLAGQYWLALQLLGWVQRGRDTLINPDTGECARREMTPLQLLECVLDRSLHPEIPQNTANPEVMEMIQ